MAQATLLVVLVLEPVLTGLFDMDPLIWAALISLAVLVSVALVILVVKLCCPRFFCPCGGECHYSFITSDDLLYTVEPKRQDDVEGGASNRVEPKEQSRPANSNKNLSSASVIHGARILTTTAAKTQEPRKTPTTAAGASSSVVFQHRKPPTASTSVASEPKKTPTTGALTSVSVSGPPDQTVSSAPVRSVQPQPAQIPSELHSRLFDEEIRLSRLLDQETLISWAVEASNPQSILPTLTLHTPTAPLDDGARGGLPDHGEPQACVLDHRSGKDETAAINLTFEEQIEVAIRRSAKSSSTPLFSIISPSSSSCSSYLPEPKPKPGDLRLIVIDGPNVAWARGFRLNCSAKRLEIAYKFFREKGHDVAIFLPRKMFTCARPEDQVILTALEEKEVLFIVQDLAYDDLMIIEYANQKKGIIISNDKYREILETHPEWEDQILNRTLQFTWAIDSFMIANDPFGRNGPSLDQILHH